MRKKYPVLSWLVKPHAKKINKKFNVKSDPEMANNKLRHPKTAEKS
jgi:hypothetical protein